MSSILKFIKKEKINNFMKLLNENIDIISIFLWMLLLPITSILMYFEKFTISYNVFNIILIIILTYSYICKLIKCKFKIKIYDIIIFILLILNFLSTIFAIDINLAIFGAIRENGYLTYFTYGLIVLNIIRVEDKKKIHFLITTIVVLGILNVLYAVLQIFTDIPGIFRFYKPYMANAMCINPNFFGSFMSLLLTFMIALYVFNKKNETVYFVLSFVFLFGLYFAQSTGPLIGVIISILFFLIIILIYKRKYIKRFIFVVTILAMAFICIEKVCRQYYEYKGYRLDERYTIVGGLNDVYSFIGKYFLGMDKKVTLDTGNGRIRLWKRSLPSLKVYPLLGCGPDNFKLVYPQDKYPLTYHDAHNVYLNYAVNNGIPATIIFIFALLYILFKSIKTRDKTIYAFIIAYVAYCVQAFFNVSTIQVSTYFYSFTALLIALINIHDKEKS